MKTALTIAGSDSCGGAGIQADIKTMTANGVYAMSAITALTAQNTTGVTDIMEVTPEFLGKQLNSIFNDIYPEAVKIGMVSSAVLIETVPVYDSVIHYQRDLKTLIAKDFIDVVRLHAEDGVDFVTLHCGITRKTIEQIKKHKRKMNIVSRGGSLVFAWMCMTGEENPFYEYYDEILDICREYDVTISLGDACRPGCLADASDVCQIEELVRLGELTKRAWEKDVQVIVEGSGHMPIDQIAANMKIQQTICNGAPFYVLGPLVTDIAPAEHLALPNLEDVKQGIIASKIAAHAADIAKGVRGSREIDDRMADARRALDWEAQWECTIDPERAKTIRPDRKPEHEDTCSMCGKFCAVRSMNKALAGEYIDIL